MATYAVRVTKTPASDEEILAQAHQGCAALNDKLSAAIKAQLSPAQSAEVLAAINAQAKPSFMSMLAKIRSNRARNRAL